MSPIRFGVIGTGARAWGLARTLMRDEEHRGDLVALCDTRQEALDRGDAMVQSLLGHETRQYTDYHDLLDDMDVDAVIIGTPDHLHHAMGVAAFEAKKHVFLEKPVGINLAQTVDILHAARRSGKILEVGYVLRYSPFFVEMHEMITNHEIGRPLFATALEEYYGAYHFYRGWWKSKAHTGGLMIQKICHDFDLFYWMFGRFRRIVAFESLMEFRPGNWDSDALTCSECSNQCPYYTRLEGSRTRSDECVYNDPHADICDNAQVLVQFENGLNLSMGMNFFNSRGQDDRHWRVVGSEAELTGRLSEQMLRWDPRHDASKHESFLYETAPAGALGGHGGGDEVQVLEFMDAINEGREAKAGVDSAYWSSIGVMGAQRSADTGKIVDVADLTREYPFPE